MVYGLLPEEPKKKAAGGKEAAPKKLTQEARTKAIKHIQSRCLQLFEDVKQWAQGVDDANVRAIAEKYR